MLWISVGLSFSDMLFCSRLTMGTVHKYNQLMEGFPLNDLLSSTDLDKVHESLTLIFSHLNRRLRVFPYPIRRALPLVEAIPWAFNDVLLRILTSHRLAYYLPHLWTSPCTNNGDIWDVGWSHVGIQECRERGDEEEEWEIYSRKVCSSAWEACGKGSLRYLREWRKQHEQLAVMTGDRKSVV